MSPRARNAPASFIGLDLAWSEHNPSGLARLLWSGQACRLISSERATSDEEIITWIEEGAPQTAWVGIDAPTIAPNPPKTARPVDKLISSLFGRHHAGVYPGNRERCARPVSLARKLAARGFSPDPFTPSRQSRRQLEIFPHLAQLGLLGRTQIIKYKRGAVQDKRKGLKELQQTISRCLPRQSPPLAPSRPLEELLTTNTLRLRGRNLKALEDKLDALLCAYMTCYFWTWGEKRCTVFGDLEHGYIIGPRLWRT